MCGISGIYCSDRNIQPARIKGMTDSLRHRGPDDEGYVFLNLEQGKWIAYAGKHTISSLQLPPLEKQEDNTYNLALGHRRLSILDLSPAGHGPMSYKGGKLWITYNGEIYNYLELRNELKVRGYPFQTQTDTEVILAAYNEWGIDCLKRFNGMWAFALVDLEKKRVFCARDRAGVKPFYYTFDGKRFCFASEIKALLQVDGVKAEPNEQIIADYLFSGYLDHTSETFFKNIYQLRPGEYLLWDDQQIMVRSYWDLEDQGIRFGRDRDYADRFYELFQDSIRLRLRSDVPVGTCLSGGLDSSSIVCLGNRLMFDHQNIDPMLIGTKQKTFSSCYEDVTHDERKFIEMVIRQTGAEKNYIFPTAEEFFQELPKLIWHQDEPFGSARIYTQWAVMKLARHRQVTVLLDGQGGDELLAGYMPSFLFLLRGLLRKAHFASLWKEICGVQRHHGLMFKQYLPSIFSALLPNPFRSFVQKLLKGDRTGIQPEFRKRYFRHFSTPVKFGNDLNDYLYQIFRQTILPSLLRYEDRSSMAFSLETRLPFLDYRLVEFVFSLPVEQKISQGVTKIILRNAMEGIIPEEIRRRMDKMGFATPEEVWFRTALKNKIEEMIHSESFAARGYFDIREVQKTFSEHCEGKGNFSPIIWRWINLELWFRIYIDNRISRRDWSFMKVQSEIGRERLSLNRSKMLALLALIVLSGGLYLNTLDNLFTNWDDAMVYSNYSIRSLDWKNLRAIFTYVKGSTYQPVRVLSYAIDYHFWKLNPLGYHITNILFYILTCLMVFFTLRALSSHLRKDTPSDSHFRTAFFGSLLFAAHPVHVEAVTWLAARKEVLQGFFFFLAFFSTSKPEKKNRKEESFISGSPFLLFYSRFYRSLLPSYFPE